jgi:transcription elongation factor GreA
MYVMAEINYVTKETLELMKAELNLLRTKGRAEIARSIAEARDKGDLRENAEYDAAKEAQVHHEDRISSLENVIAASRIVDIKDIDTSKVTILSSVRITQLETKKSSVYKIVSENEADLKAGKISVTSPIGKGLLGKKVGEIAEIQAPNGTMRFRVEQITVI